MAVQVAGKLEPEISTENQKSAGFDSRALGKWGARFERAPAGFVNLEGES
jgi:hypothetical protein